MIEVEAKVKIENPTEIRKRIKSIARFLKIELKTDDYYTLESSGKYPRKSLRIRKRGAIHEVNFKQKLSYIKGVHAKKESEFLVSDIERFISLIKDFGFKKWLTKIKNSEIYEIKKNFHIELNNVKSLGWFLEIEYLVPSENKIKTARAEILEVINKLGIKKSEIRKSGYTKMLWDIR